MKRSSTAEEIRRGAEENLERALAVLASEGYTVV